MPRKAAPQGSNVLRFKVTLKGSEPKIWRQFDISDASLVGDLHYTIQIVMGWEHYHLHDFEIGKRHIGVPWPDDELGGPVIIDEDTITIAELKLKEKRKFLYRYDYGDNWEHEVLLEMILCPERGTKYPVCIAGERACPIEDSGGLGGYYKKLKTLADPEDEEHDFIRGWIGDGFDPEAFDLDDVNEELGNIHHWRKAAEE